LLQDFLYCEIQKRKIEFQKETKIPAASSRLVPFAQNSINTFSPEYGHIELCLL